MRKYALLTIVAVLFGRGAFAQDVLARTSKATYQEPLGSMSR
jgi:hypothetical protein